MSIVRIDAGKRMSQAVIHGGKVYLAGIVASTTAGQGVTEQTRDILSQIDDLLLRAGTDKTKILKANIWLRDISHFSDMNVAWDAWVASGHPPARATVQALLASPDLAVEIMIEAAV